MRRKPDPCLFVQIDLRYTNPEEGGLEVVVAPVMRFKDIEFNANVKIEEIAPPERIISGFALEIFGAPLQVCLYLSLLPGFKQKQWNAASIYVLSNCMRGQHFLFSYDLFCVQEEDVLQQEVESKDGLTYYSWYVVLLHEIASTALIKWPIMTTSMLQILYIKQTCSKTHMYQNAKIHWHCKGLKARGFVLL